MQVLERIKTGKIEMSTVIKILTGLGMVWLVIAVYLVVIFGWLGLVGVVITSLGLCSWLKDAFFYIHKDPQSIPYFIGKLWGWIRPGKLGANPKIPLIEDVETTPIVRKEFPVEVHSTIKRTEIDLDLLLVYVPDDQNLLTYLKAGNIQAQITARAQDVLNREAGRLFLEDIITVKKDDLKKMVEYELIQGPIRAKFQKIRILSKDISDLDAELTIAKDCQDEERQNEIKPLIEHNKTYLIALIKDFDDDLKANLLTKEDFEVEAGEKKILEQLISSEEMETARKEEILGTYLPEIEEIVEKHGIEKATGREKLGSDKEYSKYNRETRGLESVTTGTGRYPLEIKIDLMGFKPTILSDLKQSPLEAALGIKLSPPDIQDYKPEKEASEWRTKELTADYHVRRLDHFIAQKTRAIEDFQKRGVPVEQGLDTTLMDAGRNVYKHKYELVGLKDIAVVLLKTYFQEKKREEGKEKKEEGGEING